ncbi:MAG: DUF6702 family protein [Vicingaceae bacterium]
MKKIILLLLVLGNFQFASAHKFYMSITEMNYNEESGYLEIIIKLFTDDIEKALEQKSDSSVFLGTPKESPQANELLKNYLQKHFTLKAGEEALDISFLGKEVDKDYTWAYLEVKDFNPEKKYNIKNSILIDLFDSQANRINYYYKDETHSLNLHKDQKSGQF